MLNSFIKDWTYSILLVSLALAVRFWPLQHLGLHIPYATFYMAVMIAAVSGGLARGLTTMLLSAVTIYFWQTANHLFLHDLPSWEGMGVFLFNGSVISSFSGTMMRNQVKMETSVEKERLATERLKEAERSEQRISESENRFRVLFEESPSGIITVQPGTNRILQANRRALDMLGYSLEELQGKTIIELTYPDEQEETRMRTEKINSGEMDHIEVEKRYLRKDGSHFWVQLSLANICNSSGKVEFWLGSFIDINLRKQYQQKVAEQDELLREMSALAQVGGWEFDPVSGEGKWTEEVARIHDVDPDSATSASYGIGFFHGENRTRIEGAVREAIEKGKPYDLELEIVSDTGRHKWVRTMSHPITQDGKVVKVRGAIQDITERKMLENNLIEHQEILQLFIEHAPVALAMFDRDMRYLAASRRWINDYGLGETDLLGRSHYEIFPEITERWKEFHRRGMNGDVVRVEEDPFERLNGTVQWLRWEIRPWHQRNREVGGIIIFTEDVSERKRAEEQIAQYVRQLETSMQDTLLAVSKMVEQRDPYTAGHERRVGIIAGDIARGMGWPTQKCMDLQLIGLVHDIGKIGVPAEILTKPGRLTPLEYEMVKTHVERGYQILGAVSFPLPIAEIIRQHHERMDGSGYPRGLKGEEILPEARVLAVADVLESMASHRPYRPALGMDAALEEILAHRGSLYDESVVNALEAMIKNDYKLPA